MPKRYSAKQLILALTHLGFAEISQKGSHIKFRGIVGGQLRTIIIPNHKQIAIGTLSSILRQAGVSKQDIEDNL